MFLFFYLNFVRYLKFKLVFLRKNFRFPFLFVNFFDCCSILGVAPASVCSDTSYYEQMAPGLVAEMIKGIGSGKYGMTTAQGTDLPFYLARSQDKTFWIQVM